MRNTFRCILAGVVCLAFTATPAGADDISGTYVGKGNGSVFLVQIVRSGDGHLTGHYKQVALQGDKLTETNASIAGASDGHTIVLTLKPTELLAGSLSLSGTVESSLLHATGGGYGSTITLNLTKSGEGEFQAAVAELTRRAELAKSRRVIQEALPRIENLSKQMMMFSRDLPTQLARFAPIEREYRVITEKMRTGLAQQRSIYCQSLSGYCAGQATAARTQVAVAIQQAAMEANRLHLSVQSSYSDFETKSKASEIADLIKLCQSANTNVSDDSLLTRWQAGCRQMLLAMPDYQKHLTKLRDAFAHAERVWQEEQPKQERMVRSAFVLN